MSEIFVRGQDYHLLAHIIASADCVHINHCTSRQSKPKCVPHMHHPNDATLLRIYRFEGTVAIIRWSSNAWNQSSTKNCRGTSLGNIWNTLSKLSAPYYMSTQKRLEQMSKTSNAIIFGCLPQMTVLSGQMPSQLPPIALYVAQQAHSQ